MSQYRTTITKGGQVTLPAKIRRKLGLKLGDQVVFREEGDAVFVEPPKFTLQTAFASVPPLKKPMSDKEMRRIAWEDRAERQMRILRGE
jgi:AbrB family looped-hinge helix DNA binding protein